MNTRRRRSPVQSSVVGCIAHGVNRLVRTTHGCCPPGAAWGAVQPADAARDGTTRPQRQQKTCLCAPSELALAPRGRRPKLVVDTLTGTLSASRTGSAPKVNRNAPIRTLTKHVVTRCAPPSPSRAAFWRLGLLVPAAALKRRR